jgi:O-methyltransferase involved in polyketide biosynthesis
MKEKIILGNTQKTLLLPLWGRAVESQKEEPLLVDKKAVEIVEKIDYNFDTFSKSFSVISQLGWVVRSLLIDQVIKQFINKHPGATIVDIGCGLDTIFERTDNGTIRWYDLDLPDTIELRKKFFKETDRRKFITGSFLDPDWFDHLIIEDNILFIAAGLFYYFKEEQIKSFFHRLADLYPGSQIVFDASSPFGVKMANKMVLKTSGIDEVSLLVWGIKKSESIELWDNRLAVISEKPFFRNMPKRLNLKTKLLLRFSDMFKIQYMIHLKIRK